MKKYVLLRNTVFQHILFWLLYFLYNVLRWGLYFDDFTYSFQSNVVEFFIHLSIVYFNLYFLLPRFFPLKIFRYFIFLLISIIVLCYARILLTYQLVTTEVFKETGLTGLNLFDFNYFLAVFTGESYVVGFTLAIKLGMDYATSMNKTKDLENKTMEAELSFLRSQIQPHFFFNTLNNLYALTLIKSKKAPETILKLSELLSYVIYEGKSTRVELHQEIKHIHDYLELEKLRFSDKLETEIEITGIIEGYYMPPLILVPFIENCFKHGNTENEKIPIHIKIDISNDQLIYMVQNEISHQKKEKSNNDIRSGIGLKNVKRRLNLLFQDNYTLNANQNNNTFTTTLSMPLYDKVLDS